MVLRVVSTKNAENHSLLNMKGTSFAVQGVKTITFQVQTKERKGNFKEKRGFDLWLVPGGWRKEEMADGG